MSSMLRIALAILTILILSACTGEGSADKEADYDTTKKMVVDILQTEDGKKALNEILSDEKMKQQLVMESDDVKNAITETLESDKGTEMWKKLFDDPKFMEKYADSMSEEQKKLMKKLMEDADFQKQMIELLKDPKMTEQYLTVLKSQEFNKHLEEAIQKTLQTPAFESKIQDILKEESKKQSSDKGSDQKKQDDESGGGEEGKSEGEDKSGE